MSARPTVLFICVKNGDKSQLAAALLRRVAGDAIDVRSAGTAPGSGLNELTRRSVEELDASMAGESPKPIDPELLRRADRVIVIGDDAAVEPVDGMRARIETWRTREPSDHGIEGEERMRLIRDELLDRVERLHAELAGADAAPRIRVFEPALCCSTGVCGPDVDEALVGFTADLDHLRSLDADIARYNLAIDPLEFANEPAVAAFLRTAGSAGLPLTLVDGTTVLTGRYPSRAELLRFAGRDGAPEPGDRAPLPLAADACCGGGAEPGCCGGGAPTTEASGCCGSER